MENKIQQIAVSRLVAHPDNPNRMSGSTFAKLVRNIERTGRYEPLIVRPYRSSPRRSLVSRASRPRSAGKMPATQGLFQIINGHHRLEALKKLGHKTASVIVWDVNDEQTDILLATLNRLSGSDVVAKKIALLKRLAERMNARQLARLLPQTPGQIKKLIDLKPHGPLSVMPKFLAQPLPQAHANAMVFFVSDEQKKVVEDALSLADLSFQAVRRQTVDGPAAKSPQLYVGGYCREPTSTICRVNGAAAPQTPTMNAGAYDSPVTASPLSHPSSASVTPPKPPTINVGAAQALPPQGVPYGTYGTCGLHATAPAPQAPNFMLGVIGGSFGGRNDKERGNYAQCGNHKPTKPATKADALTAIARHFLDTTKQDNTRDEDQIRTA